MAIILVVVLAFVVVFGGTLLALGVVRPGASKVLQQRIEQLQPAATVASEPAFNLADIRRKEPSSTAPWLDNLLVRLHLASRIRQFLSQAEVPWTVEGLFLKSAATWVAAVVLIYLRTGAVMPSLVLSAAIASAPFLYVSQKRSRRFAQFEQKLPDALDMMVSALRSGHSLTTAVSVVARESTEPIAGEFRKCFEEQKYGVDWRTALLNMTERTPVQDLRIVITAILIQKECGGNLVEVLERVGFTIRERFRLKKQVLVHTAQGRLTGWILSLMPVGLGAVLYFVNPSQVSVLWTNPTGLKMLYTAAGMTAVGSLLIRKIVQIRI